MTASSASSAATRDILRAGLGHTIESVAFPGEAKRFSGKVRETFIFPNGKMAIVVTDRISVFDYKIGAIPHKGEVLNQLAAWWFRQIGAIGVPHHLVDVPHPNVSVVKVARPLPIEIVVRGYLTGTTTTSSWYAYQNHNRMICGIEMPAGMKKNEAFLKPIVTPSTKPTEGHDINISRADILAQRLVAEDVLDKAERYALQMFDLGQRVAKERGLILVDTKYEMGLTEAGELIVVDEAHTPDSSRYWMAGSYEARLAAGEEPESLDKEFVRRMIIKNGYDVKNAASDPKQFMTDELSIAAGERYLDLYEQMTGSALQPHVSNAGEITAVLQKIAG
ncbi:MAG: phosphoribosylaminoimidazolesuccinocarboxamide synthase [Alphaproteobacteria bacterium]|nr:phosphoribosylaminoimidazolesuccinocarboxamide synthase [Alphaproteobacteria bacterium]